jgi:hypothetical protein
MSNAGPAWAGVCVKAVAGSRSLAVSKRLDGVKGAAAVQMRTSEPTRVVAVRLPSIFF